MYGTQSEILICGNDTFFLFETVFIAQSKIFALLFVSSLFLLVNDSRSVLLFICSVIRLKLYFMCPIQFNQYWSLLSTSPLHSSSLFLKATSIFWSLLLSSASMYSSLNYSWSLSRLSLSFISCRIDISISINSVLLQFCSEPSTFFLIDLSQLWG